MGGPWPMKAAMDSRPSAVSLKVRLRGTIKDMTVGITVLGDQSEHHQSAVMWSL